jgi:hypothetical protein
MVFRTLQRLVVSATQIVPINPPPALFRLDPSYGYYLRPLIEVDFQKATSRQVHPPTDRKDFGPQLKGCYKVQAGEICDQLGEKSL